MTSLRKNLLPATVFVTGASVLIVEVLATRVLSPYYGNTIFTVSSVISVILLALSVGYYVGGTLADRRPSLQAFFGTILASGILLLLLYALGTVALPALGSRLSITYGPLVSSALLFLLPALLLGTLSPYAVKLQSLHFPGDGVGSVAGRIFFWSTLGSISGSLLAGFVLIPRFGLDNILIANGVALSLLGLIPLVMLGISRPKTATLVVCLLAAFGAAYSAIPAAGGTINYRKDGVYQKITIYEGEFLSRPARFLLLDRSESGAVFLDSDDPTDLVYDYTKYHRLYKIFTPNVKTALVLGGGAFSIPKALIKELPEARVDVAEIEPWFWDLAKQYFKAEESPRLHSYVEDGRRFLQDSPRQYDLMFGDVYYSFFSVPPHFTTQEFFRLAKARLNPGGVFIANMIGDLSRQQPSLIMSEIKTFRTIFPNSYFFAVEARENTHLLQNITLVGYNSDRKVDVTQPPVTTDPDPLIRFLRLKAIDVEKRFEFSPYPVLTDNYSPVEYQTAKALQRSLDSNIFIDGNEMLAVVDQQTRYGSRHVGSTGHQRVRDMLLTEVEGLAQETQTQTWQEPGPDGRPRELTNIIGRLWASEPRRVVVAAHYDSRKLPQAVAGASGAGANDSASGPALLLDLARVLISSPEIPKVGVDIVLFDGAEGVDGTSGGQGHQGALGSTYFASHLAEAYPAEFYPTGRPISAVVVDMVCGEGLTVEKAPASVKAAPALVDAFWKAGKAVNPAVFVDRNAADVAADHTPLINAGIPTVLVTGAGYEQAHAAPDTADHCRPASLQNVGQAVRAYLNALP